MKAEYYSEVELEDGTVKGLYHDDELEDDEIKQQVTLITTKEPLEVKKTLKWDSEREAHLIKV